MNAVLLVDRRQLPPIPDRLRVTGSSADIYVQYLPDRGYATSTIDAYLQSVAHFAHWLTLQRLRIAHVNEKCVGGFLDEHLPACRCAAHCRRARRSAQAALMHLLKLLRISGRIAPKALIDSAAINKELHDFEHHLTEVWTATPKLMAIAARRLAPPKIGGAS